MSLTGTLGRDEEVVTTRSGKTYTLAQPTLQAYLKAEREVRRVLKNPLRAAAECAHLVPKEHAEAFWAQAYKAEAEMAQRDWLGLAPIEIQLQAAAIALLHRHHGQEIRDLEAAAAWLDDVDLGRFQQIVNILMPPKPKGSPTKASTGTG